MPAGGSNALTRRLVSRVESNFLQQFVHRRKELRLLALHEKLLMLIGPVSQQKTFARRDLERSRRVLVWANFAKEAQANSRSGQCPGIIVSIDFVALEGPGQGGIAVNFERFSPRQLTQNDLAAECPASISEKMPVSAPDLETHPSTRHSRQSLFSARLPPPEKANVTGPLTIR